MQNEKNIGARIKVARKEVRLSIIKLSQMMDLSDSVCSQWELGISNPSTANLVKLAKILKVSFEWLALGGVKKKSKKILKTLRLF